MQAITKTKVEQIIDDLAPYMDQTIPLDSFTLQRYKRDISKNLSAYPWAGFVALGMVAVLEWDEDGIDLNHQKAIALRNDAESYSVYATSLQLIGKYKEATDAVLIASNLEPENLSLLRKAVMYAQSAGKFRLAKDLIERYDIRSPKHPYNEDIFEMVVASFDENGMPEDAIIKCNDVAFSLLRRHRVPFVGTKCKGDAQDCYVMFYITLNCDQEMIDKLDEELGVELFDNVPEFDPNKYWVGYSKAEDAE